MHKSFIMFFFKVCVNMNFSMKIYAIKIKHETILKSLESYEQKSLKEF